MIRIVIWLVASAGILTATACRPLRSRLEPREIPLARRNVAPALIVAD